MESLRTGTLEAVAVVAKEAEDADGVERKNHFFMLTYCVVND